MTVQPGLCRTWSETPKTGFLRTRLISCSAELSMKFFYNLWTWLETLKTGFLSLRFISLSLQSNFALQFLCRRLIKEPVKFTICGPDSSSREWSLFLALQDPLKSQITVVTVNFLNFGTPENFAVIYLKFEQRGQSLGYFVKMMQMEKQTVKTLIRLLL